MKVYLWFVFVLITLSNGFKGYSQEKIDSALNISEKVIKLLDSAEYYSDISAVKALQMNYKALQIARENDNKSTAVVYASIGKIYNTQGLYSEALENYFEAVELLKTSEGKDVIRGIAWNYVDIGNVYFEQNENTKARRYYKQAESLFKQIDYIYGLATIKNNLGLIFYKKNKTDSALILFRDVLQIRKDNNLEGIGLSYEYIGSVYSQEFPDSAKKYYKTALEIHHENDEYEKIARVYDRMAEVNEIHGLTDSAVYYTRYELDIYTRIGDSLHIAINYLDLSEYYEILNQPEKAKTYCKQSLKITRQAGFLVQQRKAYKQLHDLALQSGNEAAALRYYKKYVLIKDSVDDANFREHINRVELRNMARQQENELRIQRQESKIKSLYIVAISAVSFIVLLFLFIIVLRQRKVISIKQKMIEKNQTIREKEQSLMQAREKEKALLENELKEKKNELVDFALHIAQRNEFLADLKKDVKELDNTAPEKLTASKKRIMMKLNQGLQINKEFEEFNMEVEKVHQQFLMNLEKRFPGLTRNDKRLASLLRLNLSSKEIAAINNISVKAVEMGRYRLRKKLNLAKGDNINTFFRSIESSEMH
ncbi:MAG: tetratricopeptide repeat protein [Bacteroidales bacterium]|nr:tetratricopeptide repeat protein [Bacteroidales bacterium]